MTETWDDVNEHVKADWKDDTTPFERVYEIIEQTHDGQSAAEIADRALVSEPTARRHCKSLVNTGFAETQQDGQTTLYKRNSDRILMSRIRELREEANRTELLDGIKDMKAEIRRYEDRYDVCHPKSSASNSTPARRRVGTTSPRGERRGRISRSPKLHSPTTRPVINSLYERRRPSRRVRADLSPGTPADS